MLNDEICENCGDPVLPVDPSRVITAVGGWCIPAGTEYEMAPRPVLCSDCNSRMLFIAQIGFDPGRKGENLKMSRKPFLIWPRYEWTEEEGPPC